MFRYKLLLINSLYFELTDTPKDKEYKIKFVEHLSSGKNVLYETMLRKNMWAKVERQYLSDYHIEIWDKDNMKEDICFMKHMRGSRVFLTIESSSIGDTLSWFPYFLQFKEKYGCQVIVSTFKNFLFEKVYPEFTFLERGKSVENIVAHLQIGWHYDKNREPVHPATIPLQQASSNILNLPFKELLPRLDFTPSERPIKEKYVCISTFSTAQLKHWDYWQDVVNHLNNKGYKVVEISKEKSDLNDIVIPEDKSLENTMNYIHHSEFFMGLSSGLSWLSWALQKQVIMIANFTSKDHEFQNKCIRIVDESVCNSCWNNPKYKFNKGDWWWCPEHEDTPKAFECHKSIKPQIVIAEIDKLINT